MILNRRELLAGILAAPPALAALANTPRTSLGVASYSYHLRLAAERAEKKPALADLRESGSLEQDADIVILLHREGAYERDHPRAGEADLIVAKHRNGRTDDIAVAFSGMYSRFSDMPRV